MSWAQKRRLIYISIIIVVFLLVVVLPTVIHFYKAPTCFDKKQNGTELGIDCGGSCTLLCSVQYAPLIVKWQRFAKVSDGVYNVLAYIENSNLGAIAENLSYSFKMYDNRGVLIAERFGKTFAPANRIMAVFEPELSTGNRIPQRVEFSFSNQAVWLKQESRETGLSLSQQVMSREDSAPRLTVTLTNKTINQIKNIEAVAIVYNSQGNTVAFSRTIVEAIAGQESKEVYFNWPKPFTEQSSRTEVILKILK